MGEATNRTLRNPRWWAVIFPLAILATPIIAVDLLLATVQVAARYADRFATMRRYEFKALWRKGTTGVRQWAYRRHARREVEA
jgi:hypothetical protein